MSLSKPTVDRNEVRTQSAVCPYRFTKDMLQTMQVIRQVDDKFIVCQVQRSSRDDDYDCDAANDDDDQDGNPKQLCVCS